jgi:serine/threonine-protein kinase RsbW
MTDMTSEVGAVALDRPWPGDIVSRGGDLPRLRRLVAARCAAAGLTGSRLDDFVLAVHEICANAIMHAGEGARLILRRAASGLRCLIADQVRRDGEDPVPASWIPRARDGSWREPTDPETGRGLWLAAQLADELSIISGPDGTIVSLYIRFG